MNRFAFCIAITCALFSCRFGAAEDWYRFRGPRLDGVSSETAWTDDWPDGGPKIAWTASVGTGFSSVSVSAGRLYTIGNEGNVDTVYCLDAANGTEIWKHSYSSPTDPNEFEGGPTSTPTVDGDQVYTLGRRGDLFCLDKASGEVRWSLNVADKAGVRVPAWGFAGSPLVCDERLIVNVGDAGMGVDKQTGELVWASADKDAGYSSPVPMPGSDPRRVVIGSARSYVCVDVESGLERWRQKWLTTFGCNAADAIVSGDNVFLSSGYNRGSALLRILGDEPTIVWKNKEMQNQISSSLLIDGCLYGIHGDVASGAQLRCIEWASGEVKWTSDTVAPGGLTAAGDRLIILGDSGELVVAPASPAGFEVTSRYSVLDGKCWTTPVLSGGRIYCRAADGTLVCVDVR